MKREPEFTPIDIQKWSRGEIFYYFSKMAPTGYALTIDLDVTELRRVLKKFNRKFYPSYLWLVTKALNEQTEFKLAEKDGQLGFYNELMPLYAVFHEDDDTFSLMWTQFDDEFENFYDSYMKDKAEHGGNHGILAKKDCLPPPNAYTVSCMPWVSFKHFSVQNFDNKPYYFPSVEAGKFFDRDGRTLLPLSVTCHHAACDGIHVSRFFESLQREADEFEKYLN